MSTQPLQRPESGTLDLEARILQAEKNLIARDERVREGVGALAGRLRLALQPRRLLFPAIGGVAAMAGAWWLLRARGRPIAVHASSATAASGAVPTSRPVPWVRMIGFAWPLLPAHWRSRMSPATTSALFTVGLPLAERLLHKQPPPLLATAASVDLSRYAGTWQEIARLPSPFESLCRGQPSATYTPGLAGIEVVNRCHTPDGKLRAVHGAARVVPGGNGAKLEVSMFPEWLRWLPYAWADYWIIDVDDDYTAALVGNPARTFCWILARRHTLPAPVLQRLIEVARAQGFRVDRLKLVQPH